MSSFLRTGTHSPVWWLVDAKGLVLGRMATRIASLLMGKHKPIDRPGVDVGDYVVVINAKDVKVTGKKAEQKVYRHHTGYPGGLKEIPFSRMISEQPEKVIMHAVSGMLPKNKTRRTRMRRLRVFPDEEHPHIQNIYSKIDINEMR